MDKLRIYSEEKNSVINQKIYTINYIIAMVLAIFYMILLIVLNTSLNIFDNGWNYAISIMSVLFVIITCVSIRYTSILKPASAMICIVSIFVPNYSIISRYINPILQKFESMGIVNRFVVASVYLIVAYLIYLLLRYRYNILRLFLKWIKNTLVAIGHSIKTNKKTRYALILILGQIIALSLVTYNRVPIDFERIVICVSISFLLSLIVAILINEKPSNIRIHPYLLTVAGWIIIILIYLYVGYKFTSVSADYALNYNEANAVSTTTYIWNNFHIFLTIAALWCVVVMVISKQLNTSTILVGIETVLVLVSSAVFMTLESRYPEYTKRIAIGMIIALVVISSCAFVITVTIQQKWKRVWKVYCRGKAYFPMLAIFSVIWCITTLVLLVLRWDVFDNIGLINIIMECFAYSAIAFVGLASLLGILYILYTIVYYIFKKDSHINKVNTILLIFVTLSIIALTIFIEVGGKHAEELKKYLNNLDYSWQISITVIRHLYISLFIAYIVIMLFKSSMSSRVWVYCSFYLRHEHCARLLRRMISHKIQSEDELESTEDIINELKSEDLAFAMHVLQGLDTNDAMCYGRYYKVYNWFNENKDKFQQYAGEKEKLKNILDEWKRELEAATGKIQPMESRTYVPDGMGDTFALNISIFVFELRDSACEFIGTIFKSFSRDGIIIQTLRDLISLFTGL